MEEESSPVFFLVGFLIVVVGYLIQNSLLQYFYYYLRFHERKKWKIQPKLNRGVQKETFYAPPLLSNKPNQAPYHNLIGTINLTVAGCFAGYLSYISYSDESCPFSFDFSITKYELFRRILFELCLAIIWESVVEYYWHRMMHLKWFYATFHKLHHAYKAPEIWDDMYIHPLEAFGYYCILYAPPYLFQCRCNHMHILSFVLYMIIMGICGVLDHSGVSLALILRFYLPVMSNRHHKQNKKSWWITSLSSLSISSTSSSSTLTIYDTKDHDLHHKLFNVNYSFPFPFMDMLHGTYYSESNS